MFDNWTIDNSVAVFVFIGCFIVLVACSLAAHADGKQKRKYADFNKHAEEALSIDRRPVK